jgi:hypothetical protein
MIDKGLYAAPQALNTGIEDDEDGLEIDIVNPDMVTLDDGSVEITLIPGGDDDDELGFGDNLAEALDEGVLQSLADELMQQVDDDVNSRKDWADTYVKGLDVLGFRYEERAEPWQDACGVYSTVLAEAAIRFQAETMSETFPAAGPVRTKILGKETREKTEAAKRVGEDMNYQLTEVMVEYRPEHERMLYALGLAGSAFKKVYDDPALGRQVALYIPAEDVVVPYGASTIESAERVTHIMRKTKNEVARLQAAGFYRELDLGDPVTYHSDIEKKKAEEGGFTLTDDDRYTLCEVHADLIIEGLDEEDEDEVQVAKPYVVTIDKGTGQVLALRRNWIEADERMVKRNHFVHYVYVPGFGFYGLGLIHIIGGYARAGTSIIRQLVDAGTLSNLPGGLKSRGLRVKGDDTPISPGEWRDVDVPSGSIRDNIMPLPYKDPSQVLLALLERITEEGRRLGAISDMNISDMSAQAPVGTTLALLERTLKPMAAVQARVHYAMKLEFKLLKEIIAESAPQEYDYEPDFGPARARQQDYEMVEVIPVSDPNSSTMAQRVVQYQAVIQLAQSAPQIYDLPMLHRQMIEVLGVKNADKLVPVEDDMKPRDPVSENMAFLNGKPTKAFIYQDHDAHIAVHSSMMQDPLLMAQIGQNPQAQKMAAEIQAHIAEHLAYAYRKKIEEQLGVPLPTPNEELPEDLEVQLSQMVAKAAQQLLAQSKGQAQQQQAQQQAQDPLIQLQQAELQVKQAEVERKKQKDMLDAEIRAAELELRERKQLADEELGEQRNVVDAYRAGVMGRSADATILQQDREAARQLGLDIREQNQGNTLGESGGK